MPQPILGWDGTTLTRIQTDADGNLKVSLLESDYVCVRDKKSQNTAGGTFTSGAWRTRDINDEQADPAGIASIASNQITLAAGTYRCWIICPSYRVDRSQARLYDTTGSAVLVVGTSMYSLNTNQIVVHSIVAGRFTLTSQSVLEVQHRCETTTATNGLGIEANFTDEIYTIAKFLREP